MSYEPKITTPQGHPAMRTWYAALANRFFSRANVVVIGDSISEGQGATQVAYRSINRLADGLRDRFIASQGYDPIGGQGFLPPQFIATTLPQPTLAGTAPGQQYAWGPGGRSVILSVAGTSITHTVTGTSVDVMYVQGSGAGVLGVSVDGGAVTQINTANATFQDGMLQRISLGTSGSHTVAITWVSGGAAHYCGLIVYNGDETTGVMVHDASHYGITMAAYADATMVQSGTLGWLPALNPALVILSMGANDYSSEPALTTFKTSLTNLVTAIQLMTNKPSILLQIEYDAYKLSSPGWSSYTPLYYEVAASMGCAVLDLTQRIGSPGTSTAPANFYYTDNIHPSNNGHSMIADLQLAAISPI